MTTLAREFDSCNEVRIEIGGPKKYRTLSDDEIIMVVAALERRDAVVLEEREACAKVCDFKMQGAPSLERGAMAAECADAIRKRPNK